MALSSSSLARRAAGARPFTAAPVVRPRVVCAAAATDAKPKAYHPSPLSQEAPAKYAIVEVAGTQMFVEEGKWYQCNRLKADVGARIKFGRVLALKNQGKLAVGMPFLESANVEAEVIEELRGPKVIVYKMRPKKHYRRKQGHRCGPVGCGQAGVRVARASPSTRPSPLAARLLGPEAWQTVDIWPMRDFARVCVVIWTAGRSFRASR